MIPNNVIRWVRSKSAMRLILAIAAFGLVVALQARAQVTFTGTQFNVGGAGLSSPSGVAADGQGNLYIADRANNCVAKVVLAAGNVSVAQIVLSGLSSPSAVAADWAGNLFVADTGNNRILMLPVAGAGSAITVAAGLSSPMGIAIDAADNLYVADTGNNRIVEVPVVGSIYGAPMVPASGFNNPEGVAVDAVGNLYVADTGNNRVVKELYSVAGYLTSQVIVTGLRAPAGISVDPGKNLYIADTGNSRVIEEVWFAGAGRYNSQATIGSGFAAPQAVTEDWSGHVFVADAASSQVVEVSSASIAFGAFPVGSATSPASSLTYNFKVAAATTIGSVNILTEGQADLDFVDAGRSTCNAQSYASITYCGVSVQFTPMAPGSRLGAVELLDGQSNPLATAFFSGVGVAPQISFVPGVATSLGSQLSGPAGVAVDGGGNVYIADTGNNRVVEIPAAVGGYGAQTVLPVGGLINPMGLAIDAAGDLFIVSNGNDKVVELPWTGSGFNAPVKVGTGMYGPTEAAVDAAGNLYITDTLDNRVTLMPWTGNGFATSASIGNYSKFPSGIVVDLAGNVYFANPYMNAVEMVPWNGKQYLPQRQLQVAGMAFPAALAVDGSGDLYILDSVTNELLMLPWSGTAFGNGIVVASGFNAPQGLAVDGSGNVYVADTGNNQVVKLALSQPGAFTFANTYLGSTSSDSARTALVENTGNLPLTLESVVFPPDFPEDPRAVNSCSELQPLNQGGSCTVSIDFTPLTAAPQVNESVTIASNLAAASMVQQVLSVSGTTLGKVAQSISFPPVPNLVYGTGPVVMAASASSALPMSFQVMSGPAALNAAGSSLIVSGAGTVVVQASQAGNAQYAAAAGVTITINVAPAILVVTPANATAIYGAASWSFQYTISGFVFGQKASQVVSGSPLILAGVGGSLGVGTYPLTATQGTLAAANYVFTFAAATLTVQPAVLKVTAVNTAGTYGTPVKALPWSFSGFVNSDNASVVTGAPQIASTGSSAQAAGAFPITVLQGSLASANYTFSFVAGVLTINPAVLTVTALNQSVTYGESLPALRFQITGFLGTDSFANSVQGAPALSVRAGAVPAAGTYAIVISPGSLVSLNYSFAMVNGSLTVGKATLTVMASNAAMVYGTSLPRLNYSIGGFVNGDFVARSLTGIPVIATAATQSSGAGSYAITLNAGSLAAANYTFNFVNGELTIGKATLTIVPASASMTYGGALPKFGYVLQGFVNGDAANVVSGAPAFAATASLNSPVGSYRITATQGTLSSANYSFTGVSGQLVVGKAVLTIVPSPASMTYGGGLPKLGCALQGFVNGDGVSAVSGAAALITNASSKSPAGSYPITAAQGTLASANYSFAAVGGQLVVGKAVLTIVPSPAAMTYGGPLPKFAYTLQGFVNGDGVGVVSGAAALTTKVSASSPVGAYGIAAAQGTLTSANYSFTTGAGQIVVGKATLTIVPSPAAMTYGGALPNLGYSLQGFVNGDSASVVSGAAALSTKASMSSPVGEYAIAATQGSLAAANYSFTAVAGQITVAKAELTIVPSPALMTYGGAVPKLGYALAGFVNGDGAGVVSGAAVLTTKALPTSSVGAYGITAAQGTLSAANYSFIAVAGRLWLARRC